MSKSMQSDLFVINNCLYFRSKIKIYFGKCKGVASCLVEVIVI